MVLSVHPVYYMKLFKVKGDFREPRCTSGADFQFDFKQLQ